MQDAPEGPLPLLIFPCNGNGREALDSAAPRHRVLGFVDDGPWRERGSCHGLAVHGRRAFDDWPEALVLAVPGSPTSYLQRRAIVEGLGLAEARWARVVHRAAQVSPHARIGRNVLIMAGVVVGPGAVVGDHACLLPNTVVHHDAEVGPWSLVGAGVVLAGGVRVGTNCYVGSGSRVMNGVTLGAGCLVGLGSNVLRDVAAGARVAGNPARVLAG